MTVQLHIDGRVYGIQRYGGITRVFDRLMSAWSEMNDVDMSLYLPPAAKVYTKIAGQVIPYPDPWRLRPGPLMSKYNESRRSKAVEKMWAGVDSGVFLSSYYSTHAVLRVPQVVLMHDVLYERYPALFPDAERVRHLEEKRSCMASAQGVVFPSEDARRDAACYYDMVGRACMVIPHAVDPLFCGRFSETACEAFQKKYTDTSAFILYVGQRFGHKNFIGLLAAYAEWRGRIRFPLLAVGGGKMTDYEFTMLEVFRLKDRVRLAQGLSDQELALAYASARAIVMPSLGEGFGFPVLEALAVGCPVAAANRGSLPEVGGSEAFYFDPYDGTSIRQALDEVVECPRDADRVLRGRERAKKRTWEDVAREYVTFFKHVCAKP